MKALTIACLFSIAVVQPCLAGWRQKKHDATMIEVLTDKKSVDSPVQFPTGNPFSWCCDRHMKYAPTSRSYAWYSIIRGPGTVSGNAIAHDELAGVDMSYFKNTFGYHADTWKHEPPGVGEVELTKEVQINGRVDLGAGDSAASALGSSTSTHEFDGQKSSLSVQLTLTSVSTSSEDAGRITFPGLGGGAAAIEVPIRTRRGSGTYNDTGGGPMSETAVACPVTLFKRDDRTIGTFYVYANVGALDVLIGREAHATAFMGGRANMHFHLLTHARCPNPPVSGN